jgi:dephospho-CoA kinase
MEKLLSMKHSIGLTGGIATGKSTALRLLKELVPEVTIFDADESVDVLLKSPKVAEELVGIFGQRVIKSDKLLDRPVLREVIFSSLAERRKLEEVLHPKVRKECLELHQKWLKTSGSTLFVADIPLLFEVKLDFGQKQNIVVATSEKTQRMRLKMRNRFSDDLISSIVAAQIPVSEKVTHADVVLWNEGPVSVLSNQLNYLISSLNHK